MSYQSSHIPPSDILFDTTLRDGEQAPGVILTPEEKAEYVRRAEEVGIRYIEVGFPQNAYDQAACVAAASASKHSRLAAMALTTIEGVKRVVDVGAHEVLFVVPCSSSHVKYVYGKSLDALLESLLTSIDFAVSNGLAVNVGLEDAGQQDIPIILRVLDRLAVIGDNVGCITIPDTRGQLLPSEVEELIKSIREKTAFKCRIGFHAHNDLGLATANALAALQMHPPVDNVHVTACGYGERAGNTSLEQLAVLLELKLGLQTSIKLERLHYLSEFVEEVFLTPIHAHSPVIGSKVFLHESALHQKGMLSDADSYQYLNPQRFGSRVRMLLGKHSGKRLRRAIAHQAGCSEAEVCKLQGAIVNSSKEEVKEEIRRALEIIRHNSILGLEEEEAVRQLRERKTRKANEET
ncbi:MAG TPA: LeuA family protein [Pyrinomonadaceae bacterium]|jgi:2-isopropylmalate synthase